MTLTAIIACKGRTSNLQMCLQSISQSIYVPQVVVVDFGSEKPIASEIESRPWLQIVRVDRNTKMFHKTRALNIGIRAASTPYVCLTDADQIFQQNFFKVVCDELQRDNSAFVRCTTQFLPEIPAGSRHYEVLLAYAKAHAKKKPHGEGCCHGVRLDWLMSVHGHDEGYIGWGFEDKDLTFRATTTGLHMEWIDTKTSMIHLPHGRDKHYFSAEMREANEQRYRRKTTNTEIVANKDRLWGQK